MHFELTLSKQHVRLRQRRENRGQHLCEDQWRYVARNFISWCSGYIYADFRSIFISTSCGVGGRLPCAVWACVLWKGHHSIAILQPDRRRLPWGIWLSVQCAGECCSSARDQRVTVMWCGKVEPLLCAHEDSMSCPSQLRSSSLRIRELEWYLVAKDSFCSGFQDGP